MGYIDNIEKKTLENSNFRTVLFTGGHMQLVVMSLKPMEDIGMEVHENVDQFFRFEKGEGKVIMNGEESIVGAEMVAIVPAGTQHNVINTSQTEDLKLYTIYSPANHPEGTVHVTKEEAMAAE
ncbi:MAG TPA: cupin domain-containing protein, partial [Candidatus Dojkabacteria bacterium]|nr:cupin domain-containing protein [Candidatus Dojkabacteria bacterium]